MTKLCPILQKGYELRSALLKRELSSFQSKTANRRVFWSIATIGALDERSGLQAEYLFQKAGRMNNPQALYEFSLLSDVKLFERHSQTGRRVTAADVDALLARYGTRFNQLPYYLQEAIDRIDLVK